MIAIIITIMVLELKAPEGRDFHALRPMLPIFLSYALSFVNVGIYWNNHHHMFTVTKRVNGAVLWANMHLLFWLSLLPLATAWQGENHFTAVPTAVYGIILLASGGAYFILQQTIITMQGTNSRLAAAIGSDIKGKLSVVLYVAAVAWAFVWPWAADALYVVVALMWLVPDKRIERHTTDGEGD